MVRRTGRVSFEENGRRYWVDRYQLLKAPVATGRGYTRPDAWSKPDLCPARLLLVSAWAGGLTLGRNDVLGRRGNKALETMEW